MPTRRCCCRGCIFATDFFNRVDAATLGAGWTDPDSAFEISSLLAYMPTGDHIAIFNTNHVKNDESMVVSYNIINEVDDAIYYILVNVVNANNYHIAKFHNIATPKIELGKVVAGTYTLIKEEDIAGMTGPSPCGYIDANCRIFTARIAPGEFCAAIDQSVYSQVTETATVLAGGTKSGLGGDGDDLYFDNFEFSEHFHTNTDCPKCICQCEDEYVVDELTLTFVDCTGRMTGLEGCSATLNWIRLDEWWETGSFTCCGQGWEIELYCPSPPHEPTDFELFIAIGCKDSDSDATVEGYLAAGRRNAVEGSTCDPLLLRFGPFNVGNLDLTCSCGSPFGDAGQYYIEVT